MDRRNLLARLADGAERDGWRSATLSLLTPYSDLLRYVGDERSADWRFLLPELPEGNLLCVGGALSSIPLSLARTCRSVTVECSRMQARFLLARARQDGFFNVSVVPHVESGAKYDLVAVLRSPLRKGAWHRRKLSVWTEKTRPGGWFYLEVDKPALFAPPTLLRVALRRAGFSEQALYWPKPTFQHCEMLIPLEDRDLQRYYL
ncbi:MAG: hypothetical protein ABIQ44_12060, partial [Chloroflexia bacterium]